MSRFDKGSVKKLAWIALACSIAAIVPAVVVLTYTQTKPARATVQTFTALIEAANRGEVDSAKVLCSRHYRQTHQIKLAAGGGIEGLPRNIHKNFQVWRDDEQTFLCPTNRVGPVYRFTFEDEAWKFDGPVGLLQPDGHVEAFEEADLVENRPL